MDRETYESGRRKPRRPGELRSWLVCAVFSLSIGYGAAANFGEVFEAAFDFARMVDRPRGPRPQFGDGLFDEPASPADLCAAKPRGLFRHGYPSAWLSLSEESAAALMPGVRLVVRGRAGAAVAAAGGR